MALDQHAANLVDTTINAFNGDATSISPMDGISLIDSWIGTFRNGGQNDNPVASGLSELKTELQSGNPDGSRIQQILENLADQAKQAATSTDSEGQAKLNPLVEALQEFSQQLGGSSKMAAMNTKNEDQLSNRTGGTTENGSEMGMDDMTGSDGAQRMDGGEYSYDASTRSGGVSGGSAESGSGSSGGRSQY